MNKKLMFLVPGMVLGAIVAAADPQPSSDNLPLRVNIGRQELLLRSDTIIREANLKADERDFDAAIKKYREIIDLLKPFESGREFSRRIEFCRKRIQTCYLHKADDAMARADEQAMSKDFEAAISTCREAQKFCPEKKDDLAEKIEFYEKRRAAALERELKRVLCGFFFFGQSAFVHTRHADRDRERQSVCLVGKLVDLIEYIEF